MWLTLCSPLFVLLCNHCRSKNNIEDQASLGFELMSDARRSALRLMPRPGQGCKCGGTDHEYAHDERCILYRDIIPHVAPEELEAFKPGRKKIRLKNDEADYDSAIVTALHERQKKAKEEQEAERQEAMFVELMEKTQVEKLKKAVFAPGLLSVAIISGVATLMDEHSIDDADADDDSDDDEDDEDIPLNALSSSAPPTKKRKVEAAQPSFYSIAELLLHISKTWGHLLKEVETNAEYAWHLKLSGLNFGESIEQYRRNPRRPESLSFENIQFLLNSGMISRLPKSAPSTKGEGTSDSLLTTPKNSSENIAPTVVTAEQAPPNTAQSAVLTAKRAVNQERADELTVALLASQEGTGLWDEVQSLVKSEVLHIQNDGAIVLKSGWQDNVGASILLDGQERGWFKDDDPGNTFCLHDAARSLTDYWERRGNGWAMSDSSPDDDVEFIDEEYRSIKQEFMEEYSSHYDAIDGVGRFGI